MNLGDILITGGAGFIGSNLAQKLSNFANTIHVVDNLKTGSMTNITSWDSSHKIIFESSGIDGIDSLLDIYKEIDTVFHLAAYPDVRTGFDDPLLSINENIMTTIKLLESIRKSKNVQRIIFTSSSTVYGEPGEIPTKESYGPLLPISSYGGSKLACESLISAYCHMYGLEGKIFRLANIVGRRSRRGIIFDFLNKLKNDSSRLEILGDGYQSKSYLHIDDCINGIIKGTVSTRGTKIFNLGNTDTINSLSIAKIICEMLSLKDVQFVINNIENGRGWKGDVRQMQLDISKLLSLGWKPMLDSKNAVKTAVKETIQSETILIK
jgi:UDP-glucose 4-epimerase